MQLFPKTLTLLFCFVSISLFGQVNKTEENTGYDYERFPETDESAEYPGGPDAMAQYFKKNISYKEGMDERIYAVVVITKTGKVTEVKLTRPCTSEVVNKQALLALQKMPLWKPAKAQGKAVDAKYLIPISLD